MRTAVVPDALRHGPFTLEGARRAGIMRWHLEGANWKRIGPATYVWRDLIETPLQKLHAAALRLPPSAAFSGLAAAWHHGFHAQPADSIEATSPVECKLAGIRVRRASLGEEDAVTVRGIRVTSVVRTLGDLCGQLGLVEAVVLTDTALHKGLTTIPQLESWAGSHPGRRGVKNLRRAIVLAEPAAESPMETRLRMLLVLGGLPRPEVQIPIHDFAGRFAGRVDLYYERCRLAIEYDGASHRDSLVQDNRRQNRILNTGVRLLRFAAADVLDSPNSVLAQVRAAIGTSRGFHAGVDAASGTNCGI